MLRSSKLAALFFAASLSLAHGQAIGPSPSGGGGGAPSGPASGDLSGFYPNPTVAKVNGNTPGGTCSTHQFTTSLSTSAVPTCAQPASTDISGLGTAATQNTGTSGATLPFLNGTNTWAATQTFSVAPVFTDQSGSRTALGLGTIATVNSGTGVNTALANTAGGAGGFALVGSTPPTGSAGGDLTGTYPNPTLAGVITAGGPTGSATVAPIITYDAKGRLTAVSSATITPAVGSITGLGTGVATALGVNVGSAGAPVLFNGAGGTPSSMVGTNITGTASGLTAGHVTTNANLTGDVTSVGNATTLAAGSASALNSGTLAAARGGAGTITGALKGNGSGVVSQAACADLSNAVASCSTDATNATNISSGNLAAARMDATTWTTFTPSPSCGTATWTVNSATYKTWGKVTFWQLDVTVASIGSCAQASFTFTLPNTAANPGGGAGRDVGVSGIGLGCYEQGTTGACSTNNASNIVVNNRFYLSGVYPNT